MGGGGHSAAGEGRAAFLAGAEQDGHPVYTLTMEDLYHGLMPAVVQSVSGG